MSRLMTLVIVMLAASSALAIHDYNIDSFGIYLDQGNSINCSGASMFQPFPVYLVLMNPESATNGFECTVTTSGTAPNFALSTTLNGAGALDVDSSVNGFMVGCAANYPVVNWGCTLVTLTYMLTGPGYLRFFIGPATIPSMPGGLPVVTGDGVLRRCGVSSGDVDSWCGSVGESCPFPTETNSFGSVKSLFR